jgi:pyridoxal biosynthesis lyase PdxS
MSENKPPVDPAVSEFMRKIGRRGGASRTRAKREAGKKNIRKALRVLKSLARKRKKAE